MPPPDRPPRRTRRRVALIALGVALALAAAAPFVLPLLVEAALSRAVDRLAGRHGLDVTWAASDLRADGLTLTDVGVRFAAGRARVAAVEVEVSLWAALTGSVRVTAVRLDGPELWVGVDGVSSGDETDAVEGGFARRVERVLGEPFAMPSSVARALALLDGLDPIPRVRIERARVVVRRGRRTHTAAVDGAWLDPMDGGWRLRAPDAGFEVGGRRLDGVAVEGGITPERVVVEARLPADVSLPIPGGRAAAASARVTVTEDGVEARLGGLGVASRYGRVEGATLTARWAEGVRVTLSDGAVRLDPPARAAEPAGEGPGASGISASGAGLDPWRVPPTLRLAAEGLTIEAPGLPRLLRAGGTWHRGRLDARAVLAGGEVRLAADFTPGRRRPDGLRLELEGVRLAPLFARRLPPEPPRRPRRRSRADGVLDGTLTIATPGDDGIGRGVTLVDGSLAWREGRVELAGLADGPVDGIDLRLDGRFTWDPAADVLDVAGRIAQGPLALVGEGRVSDARGDPRVRLDARGEPIDCAAAFAAIPAGLWGPYDRADLAGRLAPTLRLDWPVHRPQALELKIRKLFKACEVRALNARSWPPATVEGQPAPGLDDVGWLDSRFVLPVEEGVSDGAEVRVGPGVSGYVPIEQLPRYVGATMYQSEEMNFWRNNAIDRGLLVRALRIDLTHGRFVYGGSTVTQQLVKNLFLTRRKTLARKLQELLIATRITQAVDRHRVLELYLNCIEFGPDVYGIGPAARYYFQKDARRLTPREAVFLAMLKPAPRRGAYYRRRGHGPTHGWWVERAEELMRRLVENGQIPAATAAAERPYHIEWVDRRYVPHGTGPPDTPDAPDAPDPLPEPVPEPVPDGGRRLPIGP